MLFMALCLFSLLYARLYLNWFGGSSLSPVFKDSVNSTGSVEHNLSNKTSGKIWRSHFNFKLPWLDAYSPGDFKDSEWFQWLLACARHFDRSLPVVTVCADEDFTESLLNWLIAAMVRSGRPLLAPSNVLVVTTSKTVCSFLRDHKLPFHCIAASASSFHPSKMIHLCQLLIVRLSVMRILNHLGYDVLNLDTDALVFRDPIPILDPNGDDDSDVVGTFGGKCPNKLYKKWGLVVCMGVVLFRSTPSTGEGGEVCVGVCGGATINDIYTK